MVPAGQEAVWPLTVAALAAFVALAAGGTVPSADILMLAPVIVSAWSLPPEIVRRDLRLAAFAFSGRGPTLLGGTLKAA